MPMPNPSEIRRSPSAQANWPWPHCVNHGALYFVPILDRYAHGYICYGAEEAPGAVLPCGDDVFLKPKQVGAVEDLKSV